jgi:hypothetical protein
MRMWKKNVRKIKNEKKAKIDLGDKDWKEDELEKIPPL